MSVPPAAPEAHEASSSPLATLSYWRDLLLILFVLVVGLYHGAGFMVPLAVALLIFVLLTAIIDRISATRIGERAVPRALAHAIAIFLVMVGIGFSVFVLTSQAADVADAFPRYQARFSGLNARLVDMIGAENAAVISRQLEGLDLGGFAGSALTTSSAFLSGLFLVFLYVPFLLLERTPMSVKLPLAAHDERFRRELQNVVSSITGGVKKYVWIKTLVSILTGVCTYLICKLVSLDFAGTWAMLAFALNFIPSVGSMLGVIFPAATALVQFDSVTPFLVVLAGCGFAQFFIGNVLEPAITGKSLNLSPFTVMVALTFWTVVWGIPGALLSVPITVCVFIVFANVPATRSVAVLMSGDGKVDGFGHTDDAPPGKSVPRLGAMSAGNGG